MEFVPNIENYFSRINYKGPRTPSLETLSSLQFHHVSSIPFENLDVLSKKIIKVDLESLENKLVTNKRGGYCFEMNKYFMSILKSLGFSVVPLLARVK
jgi:Arylamine N-acetyltransferase